MAVAKTGAAPSWGKKIFAGRGKWRACSSTRSRKYKHELHGRGIRSALNSRSPERVYISILDQTLPPLSPFCSPSSQSFSTFTPTHTRCLPCSHLPSPSLLSPFRTLRASIPSRDTWLLSECRGRSSGKSAIKVPLLEKCACSERPQGAVRLSVANFPEDNQRERTPSYLWFANITRLRPQEY